MTTHYDEKGKMFTVVVSKETIPVIIQTSTHRIRGLLHVRKDERVKDELDREKQFLALTEAVVLDSQGQEIYRTEFIAVNRNRIVWLLPEDEIITDHSTGESQ